MVDGDVGGGFVVSWRGLALGVECYGAAGGTEHFWVGSIVLLMCEWDLYLLCPEVIPP